ncbi:MAG: hypothetical protein RMA76_15215 [Deltaproteobacteria bacterium]
MRRWIWTLLLVACGGTEPGDEPAPVDEAVSSIDIARVDFPDASALFSGRIQKSCSPNPGVCHNVNNYPDLRTPAALRQIVNAPCNHDVPDPTSGWDGCEEAGDRIVIGELESIVRFLDSEGPGRWRITMADAARASDETYGFWFTDPEGETIYAPASTFDVRLTTEAGSNEAVMVVHDMNGGAAQYFDMATATLVPGDPNRNGILGAEDPEVVPTRLVVPGSLERSYLWGRITGLLPGTRMPLANAPITNAEYAAIACWIEGLPEDGAFDETAPIDYDACNYAADPLDPAPQE